MEQVVQILLGKCLSASQVVQVKSKTASQCQWQTGRQAAKESASLSINDVTF